MRTDFSEPRAVYGGLLDDQSPPLSDAEVAAMRHRMWRALDTGLASPWSRELSRLLDAFDVACSEIRELRARLGEAVPPPVLTPPELGFLIQSLEQRDTRVSEALQLGLLRGVPAELVEKSRAEIWSLRAKLTAELERRAGDSRDAAVPTPRGEG